MKNLLSFLSTVLLLVVLYTLANKSFNLTFCAEFLKFIFSAFSLLLIFLGFCKFYEYLFKKE